MPNEQNAVFKGSFDGPSESGRGRRPVIFDILAPDRETSLLNLADEGKGDLRLVLHVNPRTMQFSYSKQIERSQTRGGFVEFHWGDAAEEITFDAATGGFMRMYTGLSNITAGPQGRRETIAYDKYLDLLALFHNNGAIYDLFGNIVVQGYIQMSFDGGVHIGWFDGAFTVTEDANTPYMFNMSARFIIDREVMRFSTGNLFDFDGQAAAIPGGVGGEPQPDTGTTILDQFQLQSGNQTFQEALGGGPNFGVAPLTLDPLQPPPPGVEQVTPQDVADIFGEGTTPEQVQNVLLRGTPEQVEGLEDETGFTRAQLGQIFGLGGGG